MNKEMKINEEVARCIKAIAQDISRRADDITRDLKNVTDITISFTIEGGKLLNYDVNKNYGINDSIHYQK